VGEVLRGNEGAERLTDLAKPNPRRRRIVAAEAYTDLLSDVRLLLLSSPNLANPHCTRMYIGVKLFFSSIILILFFINSMPI
jgi:hypothetical protein